MTNLVEIIEITETDFLAYVTFQGIKYAGGGWSKGEAVLNAWDARTNMAILLAA